MNKFQGLLLFLLLTHFYSFGQKKVLNAITAGNITIDGKFNEPIWEYAPVAKDFVMFAPDNGRPINENKKTEVQIVYNDDAIFVAAKMYDDEPKKILKEITQRDNFGTSENFGIFINGFNDSQQDFRFYVSAAGVQADCIFTNESGEDFTWDAIWESQVKVTNFGWVAELKIPYAALRFSKKKEQTWGLNFYREIRRDRQSYTWNFIDSTINNESAQSGILQGIEDIQTPTRLFFIPYSSFYLNSNQFEKTSGQLKAGLDIKYGISDAFTLDAILIPDFGQTKFDNVELYLGPFEQQFTENRPFFTEGTDLFKKGDLLYSRRIGGTPDYQLSDVEFFNGNTNINLVNATKISGRTKNGLGIGVLNAVTEETNLEIINAETGETRMEIEPLANYNEIVIDQRFRKNSSVSFVNTNVTRIGSFRDANVSAAVFDLNTRENTFNVKGDFKYSYVNESNTIPDKKGYNTSLFLGETSGKYRYGIGGKYVSEDFDNNDLGINFQTHYYTLYSYNSYRILNPTKRFNTFETNLNFYSEFDNRTGKIQTGSATLVFDTTSKKNDYYGINIYSSPLKTYNFYEPRSIDDSKFLTVPESVGVWLYFSSNYNHPFAIDINPYYTYINEKDRIDYGLTISPKYRFNDSFSLNYKTSFYRQNNNVGWVDFSEDSATIFAIRNRITYINTIQGKYTLNEKMNINLAVRHYWSYVTNRSYHTLQDDGTLLSNSTYTENKDQNFNTWNLDLSYSWWFAPGSQISVLYRNSSSIFEDTFSRELTKNLSKAIDNENLNHIFSISIRYFIDYNTLKK